MARMTTFWIDCTEDELWQLVTRQPSDSLREKARELATRHYQDQFASAVYVKHSRTPSARSMRVRPDSSSLQKKGASERNRMGSLAASKTRRSA